MPLSGPSGKRRSATHRSPCSPSSRPSPGTGAARSCTRAISDLAEKARETAQEETDSVLEKIGAEARPSSVTVRAVTGLPAEALLEAAADADMLVVGSRGAGGFKRLLMGSVSLQVTHHAHCPVVVIPAENI